MSSLYSLSAASDLPSSLARGFLLVEPAMLDYEPFLQTLPMLPCTPRVLAHREELMPGLVDMSSLDSDVQVQVGDLLLREPAASRPPVACAWLASDAGPEDLARHIAQHLVGPGADGRPALWRFYDPRVLALTLVVFDSAQRTTLLGPVTDWQFAWAGHRWSVTGPGTLNEESEEYVPAWPKPDQWARINRSAAVTRVIDRLPAVTPEDAARLPHELDRILSTAAYHGGMPDPDALADYAWHCVRYGQALEQHPLVLDAWPALSRGEICWPDVLARFTSNELEALEMTSRSLTTQRT